MGPGPKTQAEVIFQYEILLEPRARRELDRVPRHEFPKLDRAILGLSKNPRPLGVAKLDDKLFRIRIGPWRIIYSIFDEKKKGVILRVARRSEKT